MNLYQAYIDFLEYKEAYVRPKTLQCYKEEIEPFVIEIGRKTDVSNITQLDISRYQNGLKRRNLRPATIASYMRGIKVFLRYCRDDIDILFPELKIEKIKLPKTYQKQVPIYSSTQVRTIFDKCQVKEQWIASRNKTIIALMYDSGLRQGEVSGLLRKNISFIENTIIVSGKGGKERIVPLGKLSKQFLNDYLLSCPYYNNAVFVTKAGKTMTNNAIKQYVYKISQSVPFSISSHMLRHNFATNYCLNQLENNGTCDIYSLMAIMGHEEVSTTMLYLHQAQSIYASRHYQSQLDKVFEY